MSNNPLNKFFENLNIIKKLNAYEIIIGLSPAANNVFVPMTFINFDNSKTIKSVPIHEALYFIEYGTIIIPAQSILVIAQRYVMECLDKFFDRLIDMAASEDFTEAICNAEVNQFINQINFLLPEIIKNHKQTYSYISNLLNISSAESFPDLSQYIKCTIYKK